MTAPVDEMWTSAGGVGAWRNVRGIMRWSSERSERQPLDLHAFIACPTCRARVDECCRTTSGHTTTEHGSRLVSRRCPCGERPDRNRTYCEPCGKRSLQESKNDHLRRLRRAS